MTADFKAWLSSGPDLYTSDLNTLAYFDDDTQVSSQRFCELVCFYTQQLIESKRETWLIYSDNSGLFSIGFIAALLAGKCIVLPSNTQEKTISEMMPYVDGVLSLQNEFNEVHASENKAFLALDDKQELTMATKGWPHSAHQDEIEFGNIVLFTSGSSGEAKRVNKSVEQLAAEIATLDATFAAEVNSKNTTVLATVSHQHIYGLLFKVIWPLVSGRAFYQPLIQYPETLFAKLSMNRSAIIISSPAFLSRLPESHLIGQTVVDGPIFSSGGPLSFAAAKMTHACLSTYPTEVFGSTETGGIGYRQQQTVNASWQAFEGIDITSESQSQRLLIRSPYLESLDWYACDDKVSISSNHQFQLLGRMDRIVKLEEKRVSITAIEERLTQHLSIAESAVVLLQRTRTQLAAVVVLNEAGVDELIAQGKLKFSQSLRRYLLPHFEAVTLPRRWRFVSEMPLSSQGKRNSETLCELFEND